MRVVSEQEAHAWVKGRQLKRPGAKWVRAVCPASPAERSVLAVRIAELTVWNGGMVITNGHSESDKAVEEVGEFRKSYGFPSGPRDIGATPGHLLDNEEAENQKNVAQLLRIMLVGNFFGSAVTKSGRFVVQVGDDIVDFYCRDKSVPGKLRRLIRDLKLKTID